MSHRAITPIQEVTEVVVKQEAKSILDQILELPPESVVRASLLGGRNGRQASILHRTGLGGWLVTRTMGMPILGQRLNTNYLGEGDVATWVAYFENDHGTFEVLHEGRV